MLVRLGAILALPPGRQRDPDAAERDHDERADDGKRQQDLEHGEAALVALHRRGIPGVWAPGICGSTPGVRGLPDGVAPDGVVTTVDVGVPVLGVSADVRRLTISTPRVSPHVTFTSI